MNIVCNKKILINKIGAAQKAVNSKSTLEALKCLLIEASNGKLSIIGYDMEIAIKATMEADFDTDCKFIISAKLFGDIIKKMPEDTISMDVLNDKNKVRLTSGNTKIEVLLGNVSDYPELPIVDTEFNFSVNSKTLCDMIGKTNISLSQDQTKPILTGGLLEIEEDYLSMVSVDGYRMSISKEEFNTGIKEPCKIIVPGRALNTISSLIGSNDLDINISFNDKMMSTSFDDTTYIARLLEGEFLDYGKLLPREYQTEIKVNRKNFLDMIDRTSLITVSEKNNLVKLAISENSLQVVSNSDIGDSTDSIEIEKTGDPLNIAFNSRYLMEALKIIGVEEVDIKFTNNISPCTITPLESDNFIYLLLPVRVSNI